MFHEVCQSSAIAFFGQKSPVSFYLRACPPTVSDKTLRDNISHNRQKRSYCRVTAVSFPIRRDFAYTAAVVLLSRVAVATCGVAAVTIIGLIHPMAGASTDRSSLARATHSGETPKSPATWRAL